MNLKDGALAQKGPPAHKSTSKKHSKPGMDLSGNAGEVAGRNQGIVIGGHTRDGFKEFLLRGACPRISELMGGHALHQKFDGGAKFPKKMP